MDFFYALSTRMLIYSYFNRSSCFDLRNLLERFCILNPIFTHFETLK